jgi:protein TonB
MDFAKRQADPRRHLVGIAFVILLHVAIVYALLTGLAKKVVDVVRVPIETKLIEEVKRAPPPPQIVVAAPPRLDVPPPPVIPPPEIVIQAPPPPPPVITVAPPPPPPPPPAPVAVAPAPPPPAPPAPPPPAPAPPAPPAPAPAPVVASVVCPNYTTLMGDASFPREAARQGIERGEAVIQFTLTATGEIRDIKAVRASHPIFARNSMRIVGEYRCQGQGRDIIVTVPFGYRLE